MSAFLYITFCFVIISSIIFAIVNLITTLITKRVIKALLNFSWLIIATVVGICTLIFYKNFSFSGTGSIFLAQINFLFKSISDGVFIALVVLLGFILLTIILIIFIVIMVKRMIKAIKNTASRAKKKIYDVFSKEEIIESKEESDNSNLQN